MPLRTLRLAASLLLCFLAAPALLLAQSAPPPVGAPHSVFRSRTRIVILDVVVTDKKGKPVSGLKQSDFTILEDKTPQTIRSFEAPELHVMPPAPANQPVVTSAKDLPKIGNAPVTIMVLDELNTSFADMAYARQSLQKYLAAQPPVLKEPSALLVVTNTKFQLLHDYTQNRDELLQTLKKHWPEYPWKMAQSGKGGPGTTERIAMSLSSLLQIAEATRGLPGRKNVLWVGANAPGVDFSSADPETIKEMTAVTKRVTQTLLETRIAVFDIDPTINEASMVGVMVPDAGDDSGDSDTMTDTDPFSSDVSLQDFAAATGGKLIQSRNDINNVVAESIDTGSTYYTLSYSPTNSAEDAAKFRNIKIVLSNPDLTATTRTGYYPEAANANNIAADTTLDLKQRQSELQLELSQAATSALTYDGLSFTAVRGPHDTWLLTARAHDLSWSPTAVGSTRLRAEVTAMAVAFDAGSAKSKSKSGAAPDPGKILSHVAHELESSRDGSLPEPASVTFQLSFDPPSGAKRIRFILRDAVSAKIGTSDLNP